MLEEPIKNKELSEEGRFSLIRDAFAQVEAGYLQADEALRLAHAYKNDDSYIVWAEIITHLLEFNYLLFGTDIYDDFRKYGRDLLATIANTVGYTKKRNEGHFETLLRSAVIYALGTFGDKKIITHAKELFKEYREGGRIDSDLKGAVFALVAENGGKKEYKIFENLYLKEVSEEEKDRALRGMVSFKDPDLLQKTLNLTFSTKVRSQDAFKAISLMSGNPYGTALAWVYVKGHWNEIVDKFAGGHLFSRFVLPFSKLKTTKQADEIEKFFEKNKAEGLERTVAQTLERIRSNAAVLKRDKKNIASFLVNGANLR